MRSQYAAWDECFACRHERSCHRGWIKRLLTPIWPKFGYQCYPCERFI
jgi:hypothetical protein